MDRVVIVGILKGKKLSYYSSTTSFLYTPPQRYINPMVEVFRIGNTGINLEELPALLNRFQLLPHLYRHLIVEQALSEIPCTDVERQMVVDNFCQQQQIRSEESLQQWLTAHNCTLAQMEAEVIRPLLLQKYKETAFAPRVESHFIKRKVTLDRVVFSLIRVEDPNLAWELFFRIKEGEQTFSELARQYSQGPEANTGGVIGPTPLATPHPTIARKLSVSHPGQLWEPEQLEQWNIIVRLDKLLPAQLDEATRQQLLDEMFETWLQEEVQKVTQENPLPSEQSEPQSPGETSGAASQNPVVAA
jgi:hypothetical protein